MVTSKIKTSYTPFKMTQPHGHPVYLLNFSGLKTLICCVNVKYGLPIILCPILILNAGLKLDTIELIHSATGMFQMFDRYLFSDSQMQNVCQERFLC